jgi:histidinol phosphatase-like PHP family hydrolase
LKQRTKVLSNSDIAELLAKEAENARPPALKAFRRASRRAFLWPEEAAEMVRRRCPLTELSAVGPYLEKYIRSWIKDPPPLGDVPEIRKGFLTLYEARRLLAGNAAWRTSIKGDLQMHSEWSDGSSSIEDMAAAADERHYEYISITDHAKGLKIAGGIDEVQLAKQGQEIKAVNQSLKSAGKKLRVLRSIELNLNPRGEGDMDEHALAELDLVLGCFHSSLRKSEDQTDRYLAALRNPTIQILGHPRGRIYNYRLGLRADWKRIFALAVKLDKALEIDAYPDRQDMSPDLLVLARQAGCRISLGTDSHGPSQLAFMDIGAASALRAGIKPDRILNFMTCDQLLDWVKSVRDKAKSHRPAKI